MSPTELETLTPKQEALIPVYREKWRAIALSTQRIDRQKAKDAVKAAYAVAGFPKPEIVFFDSPHAALRELRSHLLLKSRLDSLRESILLSRHQGGLYWLPGCLLNQLTIHLRKTLPYTRLWGELYEPLKTQIARQLTSPLHLHLTRQLQVETERQFYHQMSAQLETQLKTQLERQMLRSCMDIQSELWAYYASQLDFSISVLNCTHTPSKWETLQSLVKECGWIYPFRRTCLVCDRPVKLSFDNEHRLHAEGEPALQFADEYSLYSCHGATLPERYGKLHPREWKVHWLLLENNAELRRGLIQGIGYSRICQELRATELDSWQEYTLLKIDNNVDVVPIYLLKMTCPSTGFIHALRVPPDMQSARKAICWVNWGIESEEFSVQT